MYQDIFEAFPLPYLQPEYSSQLHCCTHAPRWADRRNEECVEEDEGGPDAGRPFPAGRALLCCPQTGRELRNWGGRGRSRIMHRTHEIELFSVMKTWNAATVHGRCTSLIPGRFCSPTWKGLGMRLEVYWMCALKFSSCLTRSLLTLRSSWCARGWRKHCEITAPVPASVGVMTTVQSCVGWRVRWSFRCDYKTLLSSYARTREWKPSSESRPTSLDYTQNGLNYFSSPSCTLKPCPTHVTWAWLVLHTYTVLLLLPPPLFLCLHLLLLSLSPLYPISIGLLSSTSCPDPSPVPLPPPYLRRYARKHFSSSGNEHLLKEIQTAMGLLAFSPTTKCKRYQVHSHSMSHVNPVEGCPLSGVPL